MSADDVRYGLTNNGARAHIQYSPTSSTSLCLKQLIEWNMTKPPYGFGVCGTCLRSREAGDRAAQRRQAAQP